MYSRTRSQFNDHDMQFIVTTLGAGDTREDLSADSTTFNELLHRRELFERSMTTPPVFLNISPQLFFYVFVYQALEARHIADDDVADYIAGVCVEFRSSHNLLQLSGMNEGKTVYLVDLLHLLADVGRPEQYILHRHIGNVSLFLTGFFPDFIFQRSRKIGAPSLSYYEQVGRSQYETAAGESLRYDGESAPVLARLAGQFNEIRSAINLYNDAYLHLSSGHSIARIERQAGTLDEDHFRTSLDL
jgi:hypothetical protein